ncbi:MAG: flagellar M-ring protein FliF [Fibromonadaceae bacterium]|jgi:flagellar M-ring protein FliF|nr:flagellar M-ring protein FliF [Fibromonadaceae bacterium]
MSEFFRQLLTQFRDIWQRFNAVQKAIMLSAMILMMAGIFVVISLQVVNATDSRMATLFANMDISSAADITAFLQENKFEYKLDNDGRTILVPKEAIYEVRMSLARAGLPKSQGKGYELFDKNQLGMTDFAQDLNYRRAVETELARSIESFREVEQARVHVSIPKQTLFMEKREEPTASVIIRLRPGEVLQDRQIKGIQHLVASAIDGLRSRQVSVLDDSGNILTKGYADNAVAEHTDHNMEFKRNAELYLERQVLTILDGVLGPNKSKVKISADLDFDQISKTTESYDPKSRSVRSEQRDDGTRLNIPPEAGEETKESSITNYDLSREVAQTISSPGATKRLTVSVLVDGIYERDSASGQKIYKPRSEDDIAILTQAVKNAVGFSQDRNDDVYVANMQFDRSFWDEERAQMEQIGNRAQWETWALRVTIILIVVLAFIFLRKVAVSLIEAMNPPVPRYKEIAIEVEAEEVSEPERRRNELIEQLELWVTANPENAANLLKVWLAEGAEPQTASSKKKK